MPTPVELLAAMKLEFLLWIGCVAQIGRCAIFYPLKAGTMKGLFMGMKVELPPATELLMSYSDMLAAYKTLMVGIALALLGLLVYGGKVMSDMATARRREGPVSYARFQLWTTVVLAVVLITGITAGNLIESTYMDPLMRLVNATD
ncbi:MAG TPA: hypothetical protein PKM25_00035 [Candidatus Ozemobacteraceae bacterium]|nr:hypothetical protein [Candidatus Ozemobacteraceae bacterium]